MTCVGTLFSWPIDGSIIGLYILATMVAGLMVRKYVSNVEDFLVAGREMNVYLGIASLAATEFGIITCMYTAQAGYEKGFSGAIPGLCQCIAMFVIGLTGFCIKPLRDSGAITIPELFEKKFGSKIRWLAGVVIVLGGLLNMGVFIMILLLLAVAIYTILGGMLSVLVTDFLQFVVMSLGLIAVTLLIFKVIGFTNLVETVKTHVGPGGFNPLKHKGLGWPFLIFQILIQTAATLTWQTCIARVLAAKDSNTGRKVYTRTSFFFVARFLIPGMWGIAALYMLTQPAHRKELTELRQYEMSAIEQKAEKGLSAAEKAAIVERERGVPWRVAVTELSAEQKTLIVDRSSELKKELSEKPKDKRSKDEVNLLSVAEKVEQEVSLHAMPKFLGFFLPIGLTGLLIAAMLAADMSTDASYMLTWGSVIYNDIMAPFRKGAWSAAKGLLWNRFIIAAIGVYLMIFGLFYEIKGNVWDYLTLTGSIYLSSMSVLLIACCYWKRANSWGAGAGIVLGGLVPVAYLTMQKVDPVLAEQIGPYYSGIAAYVGAALGMVVGSLIKPQSTTTPERTAS
jgi:Na+/proline symporter